MKIVNCFRCKVKLFVLIVVLLNFQYLKAQTYFVNQGTTFVNSGTTIVADNFENSGSATITNNGTISVKGDITNNSSNSTFLGSGFLNFDGNTTQILGGANDITLQNYVFNNSAGFTVQTNLNVSGSMALTNGILSVDASKAIVFSDNASYTGGSASAYVDGKVVKSGTGDFVFPVGDGGNYQRIGISQIGASSQTFSAQYFKSPHSSSLSMDSTTIHAVSQLEYWDLSRLSGSTGIYLTLYWENGAASAIGNQSDIVIAHFNGTEWDSTGTNVTYTGNTSAGSVTFGPQNTFSSFTFGSTNNITSPLPVELLNFSVKNGKSNIVLDWQTASEINADFFEIQRSTNAQDFTPIGVNRANGNSNIIQYYSFIDNNVEENTLYYYRLKMVDFDGSYKYSPIRTGKISDNAEVVLFPNPTADILYIICENSDIQVELFDQIGNLILKCQLDKSHSINLETLPAGLYNIRIYNDIGFVTCQKIIKQD